MAGKHGMRPNSGGSAGVIDVLEHQRTGAVFRITGKCWMVRSNDDRAGVFLALDALERGGEERDLALVEFGIGSVLIGDDARIFEDVAVEAEDAHEGRVEGVV